MRLITAIAVTLALAACSAAGDGGADGARQHTDATIGAATDTAVLRVHARMLEAMGGERAWRRARYFEFDFVVVRGGEELGRWSHRWDRWDGEYLLRGVRQGDTLLARFNVDAPTDGRVLVNGVPAEGARADSLLEFAYARHINDSYWLVMPYKWMDPGVHLAYEGVERDDDGREWEVVRLSFDEVGLTPQNQYRAFIDPATGLMERWHHFSRADADPSPADWRDWQRFGPILLATNKPRPDGSFAIRFDNVRVETRVPRGAFDVD